MPRGANSKDKIARTALRLFVEQGLTETSIRNIVAAAGFASEGTFYRHFTGKNQLAWELFSESLAAFAAELKNICREHMTSKAQCEAMIGCFCNFFDRDTDLFRYLLLTQHAQHKKVTSDMPQPFNVVRATIAAGMKRREIPKRDPILMTSMVFGLVRQVAIAKLDRKLKGTMTSHAAAISAASWRVLE